LSHGVRASDEFVDEAEGASIVREEGMVAKFEA
jgi:hypothetical protein